MTLKKIADAGRLPTWDDLILVLRAVAPQLNGHDRQLVNVIAQRASLLKSQEERISELASLVAELSVELQETEKRLELSEENYLAALAALE